MRVKLGLVAVAVVLALLGFALAGAVARGASSHQSGCHSQHTCPSDHHTYVWTDLTTGLAWDCAEPGASEYDPSRDTTTIVYEGLTYYCRASRRRRQPRPQQRPRRPNRPQRARRRQSRRQRRRAPRQRSPRRGRGCRASSCPTQDHAGRAEPEGASMHDRKDDLQGRLDKDDPPAGQLHEHAQDQADGAIRGNGLTVRVRGGSLHPARARRRAEEPEEPLA